MDTEKYKELFKREEKISNEITEACDQFIQQLKNIESSDEYVSLIRDIDEFKTKEMGNICNNYDRSTFSKLNVFDIRRKFTSLMKSYINNTITNSSEQLKKALNKGYDDGIDFQPMDKIKVPKENTLKKKIRDYKKEHSTGIENLKRTIEVRFIGTDGGIKKRNKFGCFDNFYYDLENMIGYAIYGDIYQLRIYMGYGDYGGMEIYNYFPKPLVIWTNEDERVVQEYEFNKL